MTATRTRWLLLLVAAAMVVAACGGSDDAAEPGDDADGMPPIAGACEVGTVDCDDTLDPGELPPDLPDEPADGQDANPIVEMPIADALAAGPDELVSVSGFLVADADGAFLCELLAESLPPQCGGASIALASLNAVDPDSIEEAQGVQWTDEVTVIIGNVVDGVLTPEG